ncbi:hypothetical protein BGW80DRAFT_1330365 [Lactifluus volemus]|nr:hypothetical protein BGW80DRAFT_1330365 [Lactifluus volemus]
MSLQGRACNHQGGFSGRDGLDDTLDDKLEAIEEVVEKENNLIGYEDEGEGDERVLFRTMIRFALSMIFLVRLHIYCPVWRLRPYTPTSASISIHLRHSSLSREWSFPAKGNLLSSSPQLLLEEVDQFFGCLEGVGDSPPMSDAATPQATNPFSRGLIGAVEDEGDELPPFVLPADVGIQVEFSPVQDSARSARLGHCEPEDFSITEDEFVGEEVEPECGIKFKFNTPFPTTPPDDTPLSPPKSAPYYEPAIENDDDDDDDTPHFLYCPFGFLHGCFTNTPSGIPRANVLRRFEGPAKGTKPSPRVPAALPHIAVETAAQPYSQPLSAVCCAAEPREIHATTRLAVLVVPFWHSHCFLV